MEMLLSYKAWANELTFGAVSRLPADEVGAVRATRWESILYTLSHVAVVDDIFKCHLLGEKHHYTFRNIERRLSLQEVSEWQRSIDNWYERHIATLNSDKWDVPIVFEFVGGGTGAMTPTEIVAHVVNHGTYHRGLVSDMMCQIPADMPANDLPVFLRDVWQPEQAQLRSA